MIIFQMCTDFSRNDVGVAISFMTERKHGPYVVWIWKEKTITYTYCLATKAVCR